MRPYSFTELAAIFDAQLEAFSREIAPEIKCYLVADDSMTSFGYDVGDYVIVDTGREARNGDVVIAMHNTALFLARLEQGPIGQIFTTDLGSALFVADSMEVLGVACFKGRRC